MFATVPARFSPDPAPSQNRVGARVVHMGTRTVTVRVHSHPRRDVQVPRSLVRLDAA